MVKLIKEKTNKKDKIYTNTKKKKLIDKINKLQTKNEFIDIYNIIQKNKSIPITETKDTTALYFHNLDDDTYYEIDNYLKVNSKKNKKNNESIETSISTTDEYIPYSNDDFAEQKDVNPKLKYSNKEKNLIKRKRYDQTLNKENGFDITYCEFNLENLTDDKLIK